jgi:N-acetylglucosamine malate deacetylase 2
MRILCVFPHPYDESFGPALAIARQRREGDEVILLTLTRGGATKQRHRLGLSVDEMGEVRLREMEEMARVLDLSAMTVLDLPDPGLRDLDPREVESLVAKHIREVRPDVVVTYPVHGVSGFPDHLVTHAVVKRVFCQMREVEPETAPRRLAFFTLAESDQEENFVPLKTSAPVEIDCQIRVEDRDVDTATRALECYETYLEATRKADPLGRTGKTVFFEIFDESHDPRLKSLAEGL